MDKKVCYVEMDALHLKQKVFYLMRWFEDFRKIVLMNILYMWKHSGIEDTVFGIIFTIVLLFEGRKGTRIVCRRMIGHCVCGQTACEWKRINCSYIHMYILIFIYYSLVLYTFKEFLCTVTRVREPPFSYHCH